VVVEIESANASSEHRAWIASVYPFYRHDLSEFDDSVRLDDEGRWHPDLLAVWLAREYVDAYVFVVDGARAGFAIVARAPCPVVTSYIQFRMAEFFVLRAYRRRGIGRRAAFVLFDRYPGRWELCEAAGNDGALAFWRAAIAEFTGTPAEESPLDGAPRQVFDATRRRRRLQLAHPRRVACET
jgi:predicted acetyltransferase